MKYLSFEGVRFCHQEPNFIPALGSGVSVVHLCSAGRANTSTLQDRGCVVIFNLCEVPGEVMEQYSG